MRCPKCASENVQVKYDVEKQGFSGGKGCCGWFIFGPIGLLCGLCGKNKVKSEEKYWVCNNCGAKFTDNEAAYGERKYMRDQALTLAESNFHTNPRHDELLNKKTTAIKLIKEKLTTDELKRFVFYNSSMDEKTAKNIFWNYAIPSVDLDLSDECIYFMYNESTIGDGLGTIFTSKGIYHRAGFNKLVLTPVYDIRKIYVDGKTIQINDQKTTLDFEKINDSKSLTNIADILIMLYIDGPSRSMEDDANIDEVVVFGNHISGGIVANINKKIYYENKDRRAFVVKDGATEKGFLPQCPRYLSTDGATLYITHNKNNLAKVDPNTGLVTDLTTLNCNSVHLFDGTFAFANFSDKENIYLMDCNGSNLRKIDDDKADYITLTNEWIYYVNNSDKKSIYKIKCDGTEKTKIYGDMQCSKLILDGESLYFVAKNISNIGELYRIDADGRNPIKISDDVNSYIVTDTEIYLARKDGIIFTSKENIETLCYFIKGENANNLNITNGKLYYCTPPASILSGAVTHCVNYNGGDVETL